MSLEFSSKFFKQEAKFGVRIINQQKMIWCHSCQRQTTTSQYANNCVKCGSAAIEQSSSLGGSPSQFRPYVIGEEQNPPTSQPDPQQQEEEQIDIPVMLNIRTVLLESLDRPGEFTVIRVVTSNLPGQTDSRTPVSKQVIDKLEKVQKIKECSICQEEGGHGLKLNCTHCFHDHCLKPWFQQTNTCPTCRTLVQ